MGSFECKCLSEDDSAQEKQIEVNQKVKAPQIRVQSVNQQQFHTLVPLRTNFTSISNLTEYIRANAIALQERRPEILRYICENDMPGPYKVM